MWFRNLYESLHRGRAPTCSRPGPAASRRRQLSVEVLEDRCVPAAKLSVWDAAVVEGNAGARHAEVVVTLSEPHGSSVMVNYRTIAKTAAAGSDFDAVAGKLTFARNEVSKTILVPIRGDRRVEPDEHFQIRLEDAKGAKIARGLADVTVVDDEPRIFIESVARQEGTSGDTPFTFTVNLSAPYDLPVTVNWATADGSATAGSDYAADTGTLTFGTTETSKTITVLIQGDRVAEPDENFFVQLAGTPNGYVEIAQATATGTILDSSPRIGIWDAYYYGEGYLTFSVNLSVAYDQVVTVDFATVDGSAIAGVDYVTTSGRLEFDIGETSKSFTVAVMDPGFAYLYFYVQLSGASANATIANEWAAGYSYYYDYGYYDYGYGWYDYYYDYGYYGYYDYCDYGYYDYCYYG